MPTLPTKHTGLRIPRNLLAALLLCMLAALAVAFAFLDTAWAQGEPEDSYVDLVMLYDYQVDEDVEYSVQNNGTATAIGVSVSFLLEDLQAGASLTFAESTIPPIITGKETVNTTDQRFTWEVGNIPPGSASQTLVFLTVLHSGHTSTGRIGSIRAEASSFSPEPDALLDNNVKKLYSYADTSSGASLHMRRSWLALLLSVDDLRPAAGGEVNFDLTADNAQGGGGDTINLIANAKVKVELSDGLEFKSGWTPPDTFVKSGSQSATWSPPDTDVRDSDDTFPNSAEIEIQTQLTSDSLADIPLKDRCITARVTDSIPPPSPDYLPGSLKQCLGDDPTVLFEKGELDLFTLYRCVGVTPIAYPCRDDDDDSTVDNGLEMVAGSDTSSQSAPRAQGVGRSDDDSKVYLRPGSVVVQVEDPGGRVVDSGNVAWWTRYDQGLEPTLNNSSQSSADWTQVRWEIASVERPSNGHVHIYNLTRATNIVNTNTQTQFPAGGGLTTFAATLKVNFAIDVKFDTLGTYVFDFTQETRNDNGTTSDTTDDVDYLATGRYTFHVGPIAELEVRDGGASPEVASTQRSFTIVAVNNGPDTAPAAQVTVTGLNASEYVSHSATSGSFDSGTGVWTIGGLKTKDVSQVQNAREGEILTIITTAAVDTEITAAISNTQDYQVCIDSSGNDVDAATESACTGTNTWHTAKYYDYDSDNDSATIKAKDGTGADLPSLQSPQAKTAAIVVSWNEVPDVNGRPVTHYEVQKETNPWVTVADDVTGTTYVDTNVAEGATHRYRVRAVNDQDQEGPWSQPMEATASEVETRTITEFRDRVVTRTETVVETVTVGETPYAYFAEEEFTRTVAENSAPGSPVGAPVTVLRNSGNKVAYSLEGPDAALFTIEQDSGQILVGEGTLLDYESDTTSYTVEVVADPNSGANVKTTVTITVTDVAETATVAITPAGQPEVGVELTATLTHGGGEPTDPAWQWQRSGSGGHWLNIAGATGTTYTPTEQDAGRRLRVIVFYGEPGGGHGLAGAVTEALEGELQVIPTAGTGATPEEVFGVLEHNLEAVWRYDNATQTWAVYSMWNPPELNDLTTISSNDVVWMDIISEVQFQGNTLYPGWNLVIVH